MFTLKVGVPQLSVVPLSMSETNNVADPVPSKHNVVSWQATVGFSVSFKNKLKEQLSLKAEYESEALQLVNDLKVKSLKIQHAQKMVSKLDKHEWDEDCSFCMANPWLKETKEVAELLPKLKEEEFGIITHLQEIESNVFNISNYRDPI